MTATSNSSFERIKVNERYVLGPDGSPVRTENYYVILALGNISSIPYLFDTSEVTDTTVLFGGTSSPVRPHPKYGRNIYGIDIELAKTLRKGETAEVVYTTYFKPQVKLDNNFRRHILAKYGITELAMAVEFDVKSFPGQDAVWETDWQLSDESVINDRSAHIQQLENGNMEAQLKRMNPSDGTIVGFTWAP